MRLLLSILTTCCFVDAAKADAYFPPEGRWSIGCGWNEEAPDTWHHASAERTRSAGQWQIHEGTVTTPDGNWSIRDSERALPSGLRMLVRRWQYNGQKPTGPVTLSVRLQLNCEQPKPFLPGIQYYGNPSGTRIDPNRVPIWIDQPGYAALYEEHRYPMPLTSVEYSGADGEIRIVALHTLPCPVAYGAREDLWWSLGLVRTQNGIELTARSGQVATNRQAGFVKARQTKLLPYSDAYLTDIPPGAVFEKTFWIQDSPVKQRGSGFQIPMAASIELFQPSVSDSMPSVMEAMRAKLRDCSDRWYEDEHCAGFKTRPPQAQPWIMMGWADQAEAPGYALLALQPRGLVDSQQVSTWQQRAARSLDFLSTAPTLDRSRGFSIVYDYDKHEWLQRANPLSQAQALGVIADAVRVGRQNNEIDPGKWETFLRDGCGYFADRILKPDWRPVSTNEAFAIAPLVRSSKLFDQPRLMQAARKAADHAIDRHLSMDEPYWGGTLDAKCEDKEGAWAALQGFAEMYAATGERQYLKAAQHAADACLSYLYVWDVDLPPGRLTDHRFQTRGWTSVSVQNQHLDVYGVLIAPTIHRLGQWTGQPRYKSLAELMFVSALQMTDSLGVQGEQILQTNYEQFEPRETVTGMRGGYAERWNIFWITAHFLSAAAQFEEMGVNWRGFGQ